MTVSAATAPTVGFIGLGQMGRAMARRLADRGHALIVWNRSPGPAGALAQSAGAAVAIAAAPEDLLGAVGDGIIVTMLADDAAVRAVWIDGGLAARLAHGAVHLGMASVSVAVARELAALHRDGGSDYVSAPVFGRPFAAAEGRLDIVAAGPPAALERCAPLFAALGRQTFRLGADAAHANAVKTARNFLLGAAIESLAEALALARRHGVEARAFLDILTATSFDAPAYRNYGRLMAERDYDRGEFPLRLGLKDIELALATAAAAGMPLPLGELLRERHLAAIAHGDGDRDWAVLAEQSARDAGLEAPA